MKGAQHIFEINAQKTFALLNPCMRALLQPQFPEFDLTKTLFVYDAILPNELEVFGIFLGIARSTHRPLETSFTSIAFSLVLEKILV